MKRRLLSTAVSLADVIEHANDVVVVTQASSGGIVYVNPAFTTLTGFSAEAALGQSPGKLLQGAATSPQTVERVRNALHRGEGIRTEILNYDVQGRMYWVDMNIVPLRDDQDLVSHFAAIERNITEQRDAQDALRLMASTDVLTGLANRRSFEDALQRELQHARREAAPLTLLAFDLDHFKLINDTHGHAAGDLVLREVAQRCARHLRPRDLLARTGGEEFLVLLPGTDLPLGGHVAERLRGDIACEPVMALGWPVSVTASFGVALCQPGDPGSRSVNRADRLMYAAKAAGRNRVCVQDSDRSDCVSASVRAPKPAHKRPIRRGKRHP